MISKKFSLVFKVNDLFDSQKFDIETSQIDNLINTTTNMDYERQEDPEVLVYQLIIDLKRYKENKFKRDRQYDSSGGGQMMGY